MGGLIAFCIFSSVSESSDDVASSKSIILLFFNKALAIESLCFSPPDNFTPFSPIIVSKLFSSFSIKSVDIDIFAALKISASVASGFAYLILL